MPVPTGGGETSQEAPLGVGCVVDVRGQRWRLVEALRYENCESCRLLGVGPANAGADLTVLVPFDRPRPIPTARGPRHVGRRGWMLALRALLSAETASEGLRGAAAASVDLFAYQLEPAIASAGGASRILVADEVGLGKTIEAGLILADLAARSESSSALILAPAGLCSQWVDELATRFRLSPAFVDATALRRLAARSTGDASPWEMEPVVVASIDFVKQPEVLQGMRARRWDLLVVDEAHLAAVAPERAAAVGWLARRARRVVLLTATPHSGEPRGFEALCRVGRLGGEGPILLFRRTRRGLGLPVSRRVCVLAVRLSAVERRLHTLLEGYTGRVWNEDPAGGGRDQARLAMIVLRKRAASGPWALAASLERRLQWIADPEATATQLPLPLGPEGEEAEPADEAPDRALSAPGMTDAPAERRALERLLQLAREAIPLDAKQRVLRRVLERVSEPAVVFTEYRDTLARLADCLAGACPLTVLHGGLDRASRTDAVRTFTGGRVRLLLATDAAAHGLNLQARCRLVVNLDLPWSPVALEQRIGRVDRIGQARRVHAVHLVARHTAEDQVLARLARRVEQARLALGDTADPLGNVTERDVARALIGRRAWWRAQQLLPMAGSGYHGDEGADGGAKKAAGENTPLEFVPPPADLGAAASVEVARLTRVRQLVGPDRAALERVASQLAGGGPWWTAVRLRRTRTDLPPGLIFLYQATIADGRGALVDEPLIALHMAPAGSCASSAAHVAHLRHVTRVESDARRALDDEAERVALGRLAALGASIGRSLAPCHRREMAIAAGDERVPVVAIQPGLFDRRALAAAGRERRLQRCLAEDSTLQIAALSRASELTLAGRPCLLLVLLVR